MGSEVYKNTLVIYTFFAFIPEFILALYDTNKNRYFCQKLLNTAFIIIILTLGFLKEQAYFLAVTILFDHFASMTASKRANVDNLKFHVIRIIVILLIIANNLIWIVPIYAFSYWFLLRRDNILHNQEKMDRLALYDAFKLVTVSRIREILQVIVFSRILGGEQFFLFSIIQKGLMWVLSINYSILRNMDAGIHTLHYIYKKLKFTYYIILISSIPIIFIYYNYLLIMASLYLLWHALENQINQIIIFYSVKPLQIIFYSNLIVCTVITPLIFYKDYAYFYPVLMTSVGLSILNMIKSKKVIAYV
jgi:hypothetical protein